MGSITGSHWSPETKVDEATNQQYMRLLHNERFQVAIDEIRKGRIRLGWFKELLKAHRERYEKLGRIERKALSRWTGDQTRLREELRQSGWSRSRTKNIYFLERIKRRMEWKFPEAKQLALHRRFALPEDSLWKELIEWHVHCGDVSLKADEQYPTPHCRATLEKVEGKRRFMIEVFRSTRPKDVRRLFAPPQGLGGSCANKIWELGSFKIRAGRLSEIARRKQFVKYEVKHSPGAIDFPPSGKPECFTLGKSKHARGYIWLPLHFDRDYILGDLWPEVTKMRNELPGGKSARQHPTQDETITLLKARQPQVRRKLPKPRLWFEDGADIEKVEVRPTYDETIRKRIQRLRGRGEGK